MGSSHDGAGWVRSARADAGADRIGHTWTKTHARDHIRVAQLQHEAGLAVSLTIRFSGEWRLCNLSGPRPDRERKRSNDHKYLASTPNPGHCRTSAFFTTRKGIGPVLNRSMGPDQLGGSQESERSPATRMH
jgi:hypothetical protein